MEPRDRRLGRLPWQGGRADGAAGTWTHGGRGRALGEDGTPAADAGTDDAVLLFVGGPLDGRVEIRAARHGDPLPTVTHVHLSDGPKVVHRYDLQPLPGQTGVYTVRPRQKSVLRDDSVAD